MFKDYKRVIDDKKIALNRIFQRIPIGIADDYV